MISSLLPLKISLATRPFGSATASEIVRAIHQIQRLREAEIGAPLALARRLPRRTSEHIQKPLSADVRVD